FTPMRDRTLGVQFRPNPPAFVTQPLLLPAAATRSDPPECAIFARYEIDTAEALGTVSWHSFPRGADGVSPRRTAGAI
ncbi:MAG: hypothetical protein KBH45_20780, partial [Verrucomicrobia bacterium]|nr:hypothetical protein [Verrucomicrobiota bacterium]